MTKITGQQAQAAEQAWKNAFKVALTAEQAQAAGKAIMADPRCNDDVKRSVRQGLTRNGSGMSYTTSQTPQWYCQVMLQHGVKVY